MLKVQELKELIKALDQSNVDELKFEQEGTKLVLKKQQAPVQTVEKVVEVSREAAPVVSAPAAVETKMPAKEAPTSVEPKEPATATNANVHTITSPMVGTFYSAPSPDSAPYVKQGDKVTEESVVCIVEAMKLMNEIEAEVKGKVTEVLAENGELVEYGQPLFVVELG
ncbi:acetyl-CoA carboxylase biotin carboxyl carrier protein [Alkalihalobacillus sp. MEB130]|uniref:acetyl-CoA carboxylase biotin carboxyl carrier protein n=1 Tax=Alkalihalobacillus sp. MEB130 TaxID=2976704 RepID=UPI0028DFAFA3|nr:acetyl-CoA carboxylase biotin carboxyl carrier protein [Alkalihalobacillus sp. MEB130]MDT8862526.1 acetyl-CoA carboxylase biotin carboxyl carrier protein [Alkalihalobacillus sp. MEB130]